MLKRWLERLLAPIIDRRIEAYRNERKLPMAAIHAVSVASYKEASEALEQAVDRGVKRGLAQYDKTMVARLQRVGKTSRKV